MFGVPLPNPVLVIYIICVMVYLSQLEGRTLRAAPSGSASQRTLYPSLLGEDLWFPWREEA